MSQYINVNVNVLWLMYCGRIQHLGGELQSKTNGRTNVKLFGYPLPDMRRAFEERLIEQIP